MCDIAIWPLRTLSNRRTSLAASQSDYPGDSNHRTRADKRQGSLETAKDGMAFDVGDVRNAGNDQVDESQFCQGGERQGREEKESNDFIIYFKHVFNQGQPNSTPTLHRALMIGISSAP